MGYAQLQSPTNITLLDELHYDAGGTDIWAYVAPDSTEYALMGLGNVTSIVSLADPTNILEVATVSSRASDIKTWQRYAYVAMEFIPNEPNLGITIVDLSNLPDSITYTQFQPEYLGSTLRSVHNLYIDEFGYLYTAGSPLNGGGVLIYDLNQDPLNPPLAGVAVDEYAHDVYARDNVMYTSDFFAGVVTIHDVSDKNNIKILASQSTPVNVTHNAWLSDNGNILFTTDERSNAYTAAYDISDLDDIQQLDLFRPLATEGRDVIPHNVHVLNDFLVISHYTDGVIIVDANKPDNLIEVGNYDTYSGPDDDGFNGCWGAYPFLPSGIILASNIDVDTVSRGVLSVLRPEYVRAAYLEGKVVDTATGDIIQGASIDFTTVAARTVSDLSGEYKTGYSTAGTYNVTAKHPRYFDKTISVSISNGEVTIQDFEMDPRPAFNFSVQAVSVDDNTPIPEAIVTILGNSINYEAKTDNSGNLNLMVIGDTYEIMVGKWGYRTQIMPEQTIESPVNMTVALETGIRDDFVMDLGWTVSGDAKKGIWERGKPIETSFNFSPNFDLPDDTGDQCYVTGNDSESPLGDNVNDGTTTLTSPLTDMSNMDDPVVAYNAWFYGGSISFADDFLEVKLTDGNTIITVETITEPSSDWLPTSLIYVKEHFPNPTSTMQIIFETSDRRTSNVENTVEAAVDRVEVYDGYRVSVEDAIDKSMTITAFPNPFDAALTVDYSLEDCKENTVLEVRNSLGQLVYQTNITAKQGTHIVEQSLHSGIYFVQINTGTSISPPLKVICLK